MTLPTWMPTIVEAIYFIAAVLFIWGLKRMSSPRTARGGIVWAGVGMLLAVLATFALPGMHNRGLILAAVVIGGTSLSGGKGSISGTVLGAIIIGVLNNGLVLLNVSPFWQQVVKAIVILLAVIIDKVNSKRAE